jgi:hypothetical protein
MVLLSKCSDHALCPIREVDEQEQYDQGIILDPWHATGEAIVFQPNTRIGCLVLFGDVGGCVHPGGKYCLLDHAPEGMWS